MGKTVILILFLTTTITSPLLGQDVDLLIDPILINLKGQLKNMEDSTSVPYASIINPRTHRGALTDENGYFSMEALNIDSLLISVIGYTREYVKIPLNYNEDSLLVIWARPIRYPINEVQITGNAPKANTDNLATGKPVDISPELRGDAFNSKPNVLNAIFQPLSFLQYYLSGKEKEKREVRQAMISQADWEKISTVYNKDVVMSLTGLNQFQADTFMIYFNNKNLLTGNSTEYDIRESIITQYRNYLHEKGDSTSD